MLIRNAFTAVFVMSLGASASAAVPVASGSFSYSQDFNTLSSVFGNQPWTNDGTIPGWSLFISTLDAAPTYRPEIGNQDIGSFSSYGNVPSNDRALGAVGLGDTYFGSPSTGEVAGHIALAFANSSGLTLNTFTVEFSGEQWRYVGSAAQSVVLSYGFGDSLAAVGTWISPGAQFNWTSPLSGGSGLGGIDGNTLGRVSGVGGMVPVSWSSGETLWVRWTYTNTGSGGQGMGIDDLTFSVTAVPEPSSALLLFFGSLATVTCAARKRRR